jgi:hypothetical protein
MRFAISAELEILETCQHVERLRLPSVQTTPTMDLQRVSRASSIFPMLKPQATNALRFSDDFRHFSEQADNAPLQHLFDAARLHHFITPVLHQPIYPLIHQSILESVCFPSK